MPADKPTELLRIKLKNLNSVAFMYVIIKRCEVFFENFVA